MIGFVFILYNDLPSDPVEAQKIVGNQPLGVNLIPCGYFYHAAFYSHTPHPSSLLPRTLHAHCSGTRPPLSPPQPPTVCVQLVPPPCVTGLAVPSITPPQPRSRIQVPLSVWHVLVSLPHSFPPPPCPNSAADVSVYLVTSQS